MAALLAGIVALRPGRVAAWVINTRRTPAAALWLICALIPAAALVLPAVRVAMPLPAYLPALIAGYFAWTQVLLWTGVVALLVALRFSLRIGWNALYLGQHALVPAVFVGGIALVALRTAHPLIWPYVLPGLRTDQSLCLLLAVFALAAELLVLRNVERLMRRPVRSAAQDKASGPMTRP